MDSTVNTVAGYSAMQVNRGQRQKSSGGGMHPSLNPLQFKGLGGMGEGGGLAEAGGGLAAGGEAGGAAAAGLSGAELAAGAALLL